MLNGLKYSVILAAISMAAGMVLGILVCLQKMSRNKAASRIADVYIQIIRNTPLLVQLYILYFGLAQLGIDFSAFTASCIAMIINAGAYIAEIVRSGFLSVPVGMTEAGEALGMTHGQIVRNITLRLAIKNCFPALINQTILMFLFSSVTATISMSELTYVTFNLQSSTARVFEVLIISGLLYYGTSALIVFLMRKYQKKTFSYK